MRSLIPVRPSLTNPTASGDRLNDNVYYRINAGDYTVMDTSWSNKTFNLSTDTIVSIDTVVFAAIPQTEGLKGAAGVPQNYFNERNVPFPEFGAESESYVFSGTILTSRLGIYPLAFLEGSPIDLSLYTETAVLGWKNYMGYYEKRSERTPFMLGISLTLPFLDVIAFEYERYTFDHIASYERRAKENLPQPGGDVAVSAQSNIDKDDTKWMFYSKKQFPGFSLVFEVGTDHLRRTNQAGDAYNEILHTPGHWYYQLRFSTALGK